MLPGQLAELELSYWGATKQSYLSNKEIAERSDLADDGAKNVFLQALQHLKEAPPKTQREQISPHPDFWNAVCSLDILSILLYRLVSLRRMVPPATFIFGSIKEDFQHVYKWTICAETRLRGKLEVDGSKHHYQLCDKLRYFIFHCLVRLGDNLGKVPPQHPLRMTNSDELDTLMGRLWYLQCRNWSLDPQNLSFSPWLTRTGDRAQRESSRGILYIDEVVNMMKVTPYQFVEAVLFEMDRRCYSAAPDSILVFGVASLFPMFTSSLRLRKAMRIHDGVRRVAAAYRQLSHVRYNEDEDKLDWYSVQYQMMTWVIGFINAVDGITDLRFLLEAKFLTSLFRLHVQRFQFYPVMLLGSDGKPFSTAPLERAYAVFFRHCVHFAIHRSILREVYKAIITVERKGGLMGELEEDASIFEELWMDMRDSIAYRCQAYEVWPILQIQCHRGDCRSHPRKTSKYFRKCAGCQEIAYCSEKCQEGDWLDESFKGHKLSCIKAQRKRKSEESVGRESHVTDLIAKGVEQADIIEEDKVGFLFAAQWFLDQHLVTFRDRLEFHHKLTEIQYPRLVMDFTAIPGAAILDLIPEKTDPPIKNTGTYVTVVLPRGGTTTDTYTVRDFVNWRKKCTALMNVGKAVAKEPFFEVVLGVALADAETRRGGLLLCRGDASTRPPVLLFNAPSS